MELRTAERVPCPVCARSVMSLPHPPRYVCGIPIQQWIIGPHAPSPDAPYGDAHKLLCRGSQQVTRDALVRKRVRCTRCDWTGIRYVHAIPCPHCKAACEIAPPRERKPKSERKPRKHRKAAAK